MTDEDTGTHGDETRPRWLRSMGIGAAVWFAVCLLHFAVPPLFVATIPLLVPGLALRGLVGGVLGLEETRALELAGLLSNLLVYVPVTHWIRTRRWAKARASATAPPTTE